MKNNRMIWSILLLFSLFVACKKKPTPHKKENSTQTPTSIIPNVLCKSDYYFPNCRLSKTQIEKEKALEPFCKDNLNGLDERCKKIIDKQDSVFHKKISIYERKYNENASPFFKKGGLLISKRALYKYILSLNRTLNMAERYSVGQSVANHTTSYIKWEPSLGKNYPTGYEIKIGCDSACFYIKRGRIAYSRAACFRNGKVDYVRLGMNSIVKIDSTKDYIFKEWELVELYPSKK